jgi:hypothetical protein
LAQKLDLVQALKHVRATDLVEEWIPDILRHDDELLNEVDLIKSAARRLNGIDPFDAVLDVEVPKTPFFNRPATMLSLPDRVAYQALVAAIADRVEPLLGDGVFSARKNPGPDHFLKKGSQQWVRWKHRVIQQSELGSDWVVKTDLTAYFDQIHHSLLFQELDSLALDPRLISVLREMLRTWQPAPNLGIPQGPNASRVLGNFYLLPIDQVMQTRPCAYSRFMDDIRLAAPTRAAAVDSLQVLDKECKRKGLALSTQKTSLLAGRDAVRHDFEDDELDGIQYDIDSGNYKSAKRKLRGVLKRSLAPTGALHRRRALFSLYRLTRLRDSSETKRVLKHLEMLAPLGQVVAEYLTPWLAHSNVQAGLTAFLTDQQRNTSSFLSCWLLAAMLEAPTPLPSAWLSYARAIAMDRNQPSYHRGIAVNVLIRGKLQMDENWILRSVRQETDPAYVRSVLVALARVNRLGKAPTDVLRRFPELETTATYLAGRTALPSLVYRPPARVRVDGLKQPVKRRAKDRSRPSLPRALRKPERI